MNKIAAIVGVFLLVGGGSVATGVIPIDNDATHYGNAFDTPEFGVINTEFESGSVSDQTVTTNTSFYIDNPNPLSANVTSLDYQLYWSEEEDGTFAYMGAGSDSFEILADSNNTHYLETTLEGDEAASAYETHQVTPKQDIYVRIEAEIQIEFNGLPDPITVEKEKTIHMEAE